MYHFQNYLSLNLDCKHGKHGKHKALSEPSNYWNLQEIGHRPGYHDKPFVVKNLLASKIVEQILLMFKYRFTLVFLSIHLSSILISWAFICLVKSMFDQAGVLQRETRYQPLKQFCYRSLKNQNFTRTLTNWPCVTFKRYSAYETYSFT